MATQPVHKRTLVIVVDVPEADGFSVAQAAKTAITHYPGASIRKITWDDMPRTGPVDAQEAPGSAGPAPGDQSTAETTPGA